MAKCPCGSKKSYEDCCGPLISGERHVSTAEELLRSRYTAHAKGEIDYIMKTVLPGKRKDHNRAAILAWCKETEWKNLRIIAIEAGGPGDAIGHIEFEASYAEKGESRLHREISRFRKEGDRWFFVSGRSPDRQQVLRQTPKIGRNDSCPCGSSRKYKRCCGA
ncbi:MAG: YchJ family protein [Deltaproteobacteria bacterium]|nr:YchJ family protein [Deltaproteobacteria bacterium]